MLQTEVDDDGVVVVVVDVACRYKAVGRPFSCSLIGFVLLVVIPKKRDHTTLLVSDAEK